MMTNSQISRRWLVRITMAIWAAAFIGLCARTLFRTEKSSVYPDFSTAGHHWMMGEGLYVRGGTHEFRYSPLVAAFFVPFDLLPHRIGEFLWRWLNFGLFLGGLYYCCNTGVPRVFSIQEICAVFLLCIPLSVGSLNNGQSNPLVLGLMLFATAGAMRARWTMAATCVALATCFKLYPLALGLLLMLQFPWKLGWRLAVALAAAAVLPFVLQHASYVMDQYTVWLHYLTTEDRQRGPMNDWYKDFRALYRVYVMTMHQQTYFIIELAVASAMALICVLARWRGMPMQLLLGFTLSLAACWMTALGPATESATYILLAPTVAWGLISRQARWRCPYGIVFGLFLASQLALNAGVGGKYFRDHLQPLPLAGCLLLIVVMLEAMVVSCRTFSAQARP